VISLKVYQVWWCNNYEPPQDEYMVFETDDLDYAEQTCVEFNSDRESYAEEEAEVYNYENYSPPEWYEIRELDETKVTEL
jgi:hypothetical protein